MARAAAKDTDFSAWGLNEKDIGEADALKWFLEGRDKEEDRLRNMVHKEANIVEKFFPMPSSATPPTLRTKLIDDTLIQQWRIEMMQLFEQQMRDSQASLGTSSGATVLTNTPVVNNSYMYQNVDNVVTELPATSILNMRTALGLQLA
jgi:hypothetical protein